SNDVIAEAAFSRRRTNHCFHRGFEPNDHPPLPAVDVDRPCSIHELALVRAHFCSHHAPTIRIEGLEPIEWSVSLVSAVLNVTRMRLQVSHVAHLEADSFEQGGRSS